MPTVTFNDGQSFYEDMEFGQDAGTYRVNHHTADHHMPGEVITAGRTTSHSMKSGSELSDKDVIRVAGGETSVAAALAAGLVSRKPDGSLVINDPTGRPNGEAPRGHSQDHWIGEQAHARGAADSEQQEASEGQDSGEPEMEPMDSDTEALITRAAESGEDSTIAGIVSEVSKGVDASDERLGYIASRLGLEPEEARQQYETVKAGFARQASERVSKETGLDAESIFAWAWENQPDLMGEAVQNHLNNRNTNGYTKVAQSYVENLDRIDPDGLMQALENNGFENVERTKDGKILFSDPELGRMEWRSAVKSGVIKPAGL